MKVKILNDQKEKVFAVVFEKGDEFMAGMRDFAVQHQISAAQINAIGAFSRTMLGYFDRETMDYVKIPVEEQAEVLVLTGNIALDEDHPKIHAHTVLGRRDGMALGGHVLEAHVWPTLEAIVSESPAHLRRTTDRETGLALLQL